MSTAPIICFGQQPCGFFPKRYLFAKIQTARRLQNEIGGEIVFFFHDSDHDPRETRTILRVRKSGELRQLNFAFVNQIVRLYSPLYLKRIAAGWQEKTLQQLTTFAGHPGWIEEFRGAAAVDAAGFCLEMYGRMGLLEGLRVARSSAAAFRAAACEISDYFADVPYRGEIVRARHVDGELKLHKGGGVYESIPITTFTKEQISPTRDSRFGWMQSVLHCTHYIAGGSEQLYLNRDESPNVTFVNRDPIERADEAYTDIPT